MDLKREAGGRTLQRKKLISILNDKVIENNWRLLKEGKISSKKFIIDTAENLKHGRFLVTTENGKLGCVKQWKAFCI